MEAFANSDLGPHAEGLISGCLDCLDGRVTQASPASWRFAHPGEGKARTTITLHGNWLGVERILSHCRVTRRARAMRQIWHLLDPQLSLPSGARAVLPVGGTRARIRAERPLLQTSREDPALLGRWIGMACADAASCDGGAPTTAADFDAEGAQQLSGTVQVNIPELCTLAGWSATQRGTSDEAAIELPTRYDGVCHAVATWEGRVARFHVELGVVGDAEMTLACQAALAVALLRAAESVCTVRSTATRNDRRVTAALQVCLQPPVGIEILNHALSALAFAHQQVSSELGALASDDSLANTYLASQGVR